MANIMTRAGKGAPLSWNEADTNFINLNTDKVETSTLANYSTTVETDASIVAALAVHINDAIDAHVSSAIGYLPAGTGATSTDVQTKLREFVSVKDFGAVGNGIADDTAAIQSALNVVGESGGGVLLFPPGIYVISNALLVWSNTTVKGAGIGATVIKHGSSHCFKNKNYSSTGDSNITIRGFTFDANTTYDGGVAVVGVTGLKILENEFKNIKVTGVTVGVGVGASASANSYDVEVCNNLFNVPDYGIVLDSSTSGVIERVRIHSNYIRTAWGSGISLARVVRNASITGNNFFIPGDDSGTPQVGIGIKLWDGINANNAPTDITILANTFTGATTRTSLFGVSAANWTNNLSVIGNTFKLCTYAFFNNFSGEGANNVTFADNLVKNCDFGFYNDNSSDVSPVITGNQFETCTIGIRSSLNHALVSGNRFANITQKAIYANNPSEGAQITGNTFWNIGHEAVFMSTGGSSNEICNISGNTFDNICTAADNTYNVIQLNDQDHVVSSNMIRNGSTTVKPSYIIGGTGNNRVITDNWMYGARLGYRSTSGVSDVYANNRERGGIG